MSQPSRKFAPRSEPSTAKCNRSASNRPSARPLRRKLDNFFFKSALAALSSLAIVSCNTAGKKGTVEGPVGSAEGQWRGRALVKNLKTGKSGTMTIDILAREPSQLRMEIMGSFGVHVASIALNGDEVRSILTQERRFVSAPAQSDALIKVVPIRIPPSALMSVLFERPLPTDDWSCQQDSTGAPTSCSHKQEQVKVDWLERKDHMRRLKIAAPEAEIEMVIDETKARVNLNGETFTLNPPSGYKQERVTSS